MSDYKLHIANAREEIDIAINEVRMAYHASVGEEKAALWIKYKNLVDAKEHLIIASGANA